MSDVLLFQTDNDGDMEIEDGIATLTPGLGVTAYLALFGGNEEDDGSQTTPKQYWGNLDETNDSRKYRSATQNILNTAPPIPANLGKLEDAAIKDLNFFITDNIASDVSVTVVMPGLNRVKYTIKITAEGFENEFEFVENWRASTNGP